MLARVSDLTPVSIAIWKIRSKEVQGREFQGLLDGTVACITMTRGCDADTVVALVNDARGRALAGGEVEED